MNRVRIAAALRRQVRERANGHCEYCLIAESQAFFPHELDHLIAQKPGGETTLGNLGLACFDCNRFKGTDIASVDDVTGEIVGLFNPRAHHWPEHFSFGDGDIIPLTPVGRVTEKSCDLIFRIVLKFGGNS